MDGQTKNVVVVVDAVVVVDVICCLEGQHNGIETKSMPMAAIINWQRQQQNEQQATMSAILKGNNTECEREGEWRGGEDGALGRVRAR